MEERMGGSVVAHITHGVHHCFEMSVALDVSEEALVFGRGTGKARQRQGRGRETHTERDVSRGRSYY